MAFNIDYDRGVIFRQHSLTGIDVYMYVDDPGVYLSAHGTPLAEDLAAEAGFPVAEYARSRLLKTRMRDAMDKIKAEMEVAEANSMVVREKGGFSIVDIGLGRHKVESPEGDNLTPNPLPLEQANALLDKLVPDEDPS